MNDSRRLNGAFGTLNAEDIACRMILTGSTGVRDWDLKDYLQEADHRGVTDWIGTHVGADEHGGAFWDHQEVLRYRHDNSPVETLWFSFNHHRPELAGILTDALQTEGLTVQPREHDTDCVIVTLGGRR